MNTNSGFIGFLKEHTIIYLLLREPARIVVDFPKVLSVVRSESYFPEKERKSYLKRLMDNLAWLFKYREANYFYNMYGFDVVWEGNPEEYVDYLSFMIIRDKMNRTKNSWDNQAVLLRDKFLFYKYMKSNGLPVPEVFAVLNDGEMYNSDFEPIELDSLAAEKDYFVKDQKGECASFVTHVRDFADLKDKWEEIRKHNCIFQRAIRQSPAMAEINPGSINTLRIVSINKNGRVYILTSLLRIGTNKTGNVDNLAKGGLAVGIDEKGVLKQYGYYKPGYGTKTDVHPDSGVRFTSFFIPKWNEAIDAVMKAHRVFHGLRSIGWDVAITEDGPCFIEGNDNWEISLHQVADKGLKREWCEAMGG